MAPRPLPWLTLCLATSLPTRVAQAEGTAQLGTTQALRAGTVLHLDIVEPATERIRWQGQGSVTVRAPDGTFLTTLASGASAVPSAGVGAYQLTVDSQQNQGQTWDVAVEQQTDARGRLHSYNWQFNAGSFASAASTSASFYALVPTGGPGHSEVIELSLNGLAGYIYDLNANQTGVEGSNAGRSVPELGNSVQPQYAIYLAPPTVAAYSSASIGVFGLDYVGGVDTDVDGQPLAPCDQLLPGQSRGYFYFTSLAAGTYHLQCDLDGDGTFETSSADDLLLMGAAVSGTNVVAWDGRNGGTAVASGTYACRVRITIGEFHYVGRDIETSYLGMRIYRVQADLSRSALPMYWNDALVQASDVPMPNGAYGRERSEGEVVPGPYGVPPVPNVTARSWGDFTGAGKGNLSYLDTYVWLDEAISAVVNITAADDRDGDGDGLTDYEERCLVGSDPALPDTDGDGTPDGTEYTVPESTAFSGLESSGRLAIALARRAIATLRRAGAGPLVLPLASGDSLADLIPASVAGASAELRPPTDLVLITNASAVHGADFLAPDGARKGGMLLVETFGEPYEHQKAICDRVRGGELLDVRLGEHRGVPLYWSLLVSRDTGRLEHAVSLSFIEDPQSGEQVPDSFWIRDPSAQLPADARVITLQLWGANAAFSQQLLTAVLARVESTAPVRWPTPPARFDESSVLDGSYRASLARARPPSVLIEQGAVLGSQVSLRLRRLRGGGDARLRVVSLRDDGARQEVSLVAAALVSGATRLTFALPPLLDATIEVLDGEELVDRVWLSDGAWAPFDSSIWQGGDGASSFSRTDCVPSRRPAPAGTLLELAGCAAVTFAHVPDFGGVARHFTRPLDWAGATSLTYWVRTDRPYDLCAENAQHRRCVAMPARPRGAFEAVPVSALGTAPQLLSFAAARTGALAMEVSTLALTAQALDTRPTPAGGCSSQRGAGAWTIGLLLLGLAARRRTARRPSCPKSRREPPAR